MTRLSAAIIIALLLVSAAASALADCASNPMDCSTDSTALIGSFELQAAEVISEITAARALALRQLESKSISAAQAQSVQTRADRARALYQQARIACGATSSEGNCLGSSRAKALQLLEQARKAVP